MGWWTAANQAHAFNRLVSAGLSPFGAAGLVSRWVNVESPANGPFSINPTSGAFGIAQWLGARKAGINGNTDFDAQLNYVLSELNGSESRAGNFLRAAGDRYAGAVGATMYERAEGYHAATGTDNWTERTLTGIPAVLALAGETATPPVAEDFPIVNYSSNGNFDEASVSNWPSGSAPEFSPAGLGIGGVVAIALAALAVVLILDL